MIITLLLLTLLFTLLVFSKLPADLLFLAAVAVLILTDILTPEQAFSGFSHPVLFTLASLYVIAAALKECGAINWIGNILLGHPRTELKAMLRMLSPAALLSSVLNNTAVVAMLIPAIQLWAKRLGLHPSTFLLPLSYAAIVGGTLTVIGTSTNLIVAGLSENKLGISIGLFEPAKIGLPIVIITGLYLILFSRKLLPQHDTIVEKTNSDRRYRVAFQLTPESNCAGKSITEAGLRHLPNGFLSDIERDGRVLAGVPPETRLEANDILMFVGGPECAADLRNIKGLIAAEGNPHKLPIPQRMRCLTEVVLSNDFPYLGSSIRESAFRTNYNAVVLSVSKNGKKVPGKLGDITLEMGDTLLLESGIDFIKQYQYRKDFLLVAALDDSTSIEHKKAPIALAILCTVILSSSLNLLPIVLSTMLGAGLMIATRCISAGNARRSLDLTVICIIGSSFALGAAITSTGAAQYFAEEIILFATGGPWLALLAIYVCTAIMTELITNNAAAVLMFPIASSVSATLGVSATPFVMALMIAASASFMTPIGYQTNLMVQGPGGYRFGDYLRLGSPLALICMLLSVVLCPVIWPF